MLQANLQACNCSPSDTSIVLSVLAAMPDEFRPTVEQLRYDQSSATLPLSKVKTVLQYREAHLQLDRQKQLDTSSSSSLWASSSSFSPRGAGYSGGSGWRGRGGVRVPQPGRSSNAAMQRSSSPAHSDHSTREENPHAHMTCHFCNKEGHIMSECRAFDRNQRERLSLAARDGSRYLATFLDEFTKFSVVMPLRSKDQVPDCIITVIQQLETQSGSKCKAIRTDNGCEYVNKKVQAFCSSKGILHQHSAPYSPEQNGAAERLNRTIVEKLRSMLHAAHLPVEFWADSAKAANHVRNVLPVTGQSQTPWHAFFGVKPDVSGLRIFGSKVWVHIPRHQRSKLQPKAAAGVFIGYQPGSKAYKVFLDGREQMSKDVTFDELSPATDELTKTRTGSHLQPARLPSEGDRRQQQQQQQQQQTDTSDSGSDDSGSPDRTSSSSSSNSSSAPSSSAQHPRSRPIDWRVIQDDSDSGQSDGEDSKSQVRRNLFGGSASSRGSGTLAQPSHSAVVSSQPSGIGRHRLQPAPAPLPAPAPPAPEHSHSAVVSSQPSGIGDIERFKARLVAKGFLQMSGVDVGDVYAPVSKHTTLRTILAKAAAENMEIHPIDFETAFLNGKLEEHEVIFVQQPEGFEEGSSNTVCRLQKALYGLRQAPRAWHARLCEELLAIGFQASQADPALFTLQLPSGPVYLLVYVDDCLLCTQQGDTAGLAHVKQQLASVFNIKDMGDTRWFLGMQITRNRAEGTIMLDQRQFINELVTTHSMSSSHSKPVPMAPAIQLVREGDPLDTSVHHYSALVGSLLYLTCCTRPDIAFAVGALARHMSSPTKQHWAGACNVLSYLKGTCDHGLLFGGVTGLQGFSDSDYAGDKDTARSTTGYLFTLNGGAISWSSRLQPTVALSTAEAEYMAASNAAKEALWPTRLQLCHHRV
ncbi:hypothetical protein QJQ45_007161 [Haematococcus lacustris]|nr:hypothetical protein QJQ45_007161 [Haematococcus lacustris]